MSTFDQYEVEVEDENKGLYKLNIDPEKGLKKKRFPSGWFSKYGDKIILAIGIILIAGISFQAGYLKGQKSQKEPVTVNQTTCPSCPKEENNITSQNNNSPEDNQINSESQQSNSENQKCAYVASKNSNKYHLPTCQFAQKIKPENKICFSSAEEAASRGYQSAKCCIK